MNYYIRIWVVFIAVVLGFVLYVFAVQPLLTRMCILDTQRALNISYQQYQNSVLVHTLPLGLWVWFDGRDVFVYGLPTGRLCENEEFEPAYMIDASKNEVLGWTCARNIKEVVKFYEGIPKQYLFKYKPSVHFNVYDLINLLADERIITLKGAKECDSSSECGAGRVCQAGECVTNLTHQWCKTNADCESGDVCQNGQCISGK